MEMQSMKFRTERSRTGFATKPLIFVPAGKGVSDLREQLSDPLIILLAIVGLLLLIACANVANLLLARAVGRQKEIAVRLAVGASRMLLIRQLLAESLVLSLAGGALGIFFAWWTGSALLALLANPAEIPITASPDVRVFAFTFALSVLTGILFGLAPAWQATSPKLALTLKDQANNVSGGTGHVRLRKVLVVSQVALSLLMLIAAALFTRSLSNLKNVDLGFRQEHLLSFGVDPSLASYKADRIRRFAEDVQARVAAVPRVQSAAIGTIPLIADDQNMSTIFIEGHQPKDDEDMNPSFDAVSPGYFQTLGIPLLAGRDFAARDRSGAPRVAVVNDVFVKYYFPKESPIGRRFGIGRQSRPDIEIVGVVRAAKYSRVDEKPPREVYLAYAQDENPSSMVVYARTAGDPKTTFAALRREVTALDAALPITNLRTMDDQIDESLGRAACHGSTLRVLRNTRDCARRHRAVWRDGVHGDPAYARNRHSPGARRGPRRSALAGAAGSGAADPRRRGNCDPRGARRDSPGAVGALRNSAQRSCKYRRGSDPAHRRLAAGRLHSSSQGHSHRPGHRAAV